MRYISKLAICAVTVCVVMFPSLAHSQADSQNVLLSIPEIKNLYLPTVTIDLSLTATDFSLTESGLSSTAIVKTGSSQYSFFTLAQTSALRITSELDSAIPAGLTLKTEMSTDGTSIGTPNPTSGGQQILSNASAVDLLTNIGNGVYSGATVTYELEYDVNTVDLSATANQTVVVLYTITL